jgi:hypothetical protein
MLHRVLIEMGRRSQRPQVDVHDPVRLGQQPRRFRRRFLAQVNRPSQQQQDDQNNGDGDLLAPVGHLQARLPLFREAALSIFSSAPSSRTWVPYIPAVGDWVCGPSLTVSSLPIVSLPPPSPYDIFNAGPSENGCIRASGRGGSGMVRAGVAQLVEHLICNQRVGGSNPFASSSLPSSDKCEFLLELM